jgi:hypothetical protein
MMQLRQRISKFGLGVSLIAGTFLINNATAEANLADPLCSVLKELLPEVKDYMPAGARAQLVIATFEKFDGDPEALKRLRTEIDSATIAGCPKERDAMLGILKTATLAEGLQ